MSLLPSLSIPSLKFHEAGTEYTGTLTEIGEPQQARKYSPTGDGGPDFWDEEKTRPKMQRRFLIQCHPDPAVPGDDGVRALYAIVSGKPGGLFYALNKALEKADDLGGRLTVKYTGNDPDSKNPQNPRKLYEAVYVNPSLGQKLMQAAPAPAPASTPPPTAPAAAAAVDAPPAGFDQATWAGLPEEAKNAVLAAQQ